MQRIVQALEETFPQVHIADGVNGLGKGNTTRKLAVAVAPVMLNTLEMPLVNQDDDLLSLALINLLEEILITLIDKDLFQSGEEDVSALCVPVDKVLVKALLGEGLRVGLRNLLAVGSQFLSVEALGVLDALEDVVRNVHAGLVV